MMRTYMVSLGKIRGDAGMKDMLVVSDLQVMQHVLLTRYLLGKISKGLRVHSCYEALYGIYLGQFFIWRSEKSVKLPYKILMQITNALEAVESSNQK